MSVLASVDKRCRLRQFRPMPAPTRRSPMQSDPTLVQPIYDTFSGPLHAEVQLSALWSPSNVFPRGGVRQCPQKFSLRKMTRLAKRFS